MGDKTQLLSLILVSRYRQPWTILLGVFIATILNHALASLVGAWLSSLFTPATMSWILAATFFIFAFWILIPDKESDVNESTKFGVFMTTVIVFFLAEMGDKTQLATVALGAKYSSVMLVTVGTTIGMMGSNALAVFLGHKLLKRISMKWMRRIASLLFMLFGLIILMGF